MTTTAIKNSIPMTSKYSGGKCFLCKQEIEKGEAIFYCPDRFVNKGESKACHQDCSQAVNKAHPVDTMQVLAASVKPAPVVAPAPIVTPTVDDNLDLIGFFTVVWEENGKKERRTLRIRRQRKDASFAPGQKIISLLTGSDNENDYTGFGFVDGRTLSVWGKKQGMTAAIKAAHILLEGDNYKEAGKAYVLESNRCCRCNRHLTVDTSIEQAMGPVCAKKMGM